MARIKYSALIEDIRGSVGGTTFQGNKHGYTIKAKSNVVKPKSPLQNRSKSITSIVTRAWASLTSTQRGYYNTYASTYPQYARHNPSSVLSGYEVFLRYYSLRLLTNLGFLTPATFTPSTVPTFDVSIYLDSGDLTIEFDNVTNNGNAYSLMFISSKLPDSQNFIGTRTRYLQYILTDFDTIVVNPQYLALYSALPFAGDRIALDIVQIGTNHPQVSARQTYILTVGSV